MSKTGRPVKDFDLGEVEKLGTLGATAGEMAAWFGCGSRTVERRMGKLEGDFRRAYDAGFGRLKISLRRKQIESAKAGNTTMLIWLVCPPADVAPAASSPGHAPKNSRLTRARAIG